MQQIFNQYSFVFITLAIILLSYLILQRYIANKRLLTGTMVLICGLGLAVMFLLRPGLSDVDDSSAFQQNLENGRPTFLEFFSNYCAGCLALRPSVDLLVADIQDEVNVLRIDIHSDLGLELREDYAFSYSPEFILFDRTGQEVWRDHSLPQSEQIIALITG